MPARSSRNRSSNWSSSMSASSQARPISLLRSPASAAAAAKPHTRARRCSSFIDLALSSAASGSPGISPPAPPAARSAPGRRRAGGGRDAEIIRDLPVLAPCQGVGGLERQQLPAPDFTRLEAELLQRCLDLGLVDPLPHPGLVLEPPARHLAAFAQEGVHLVVDLLLEQRRRVDQVLGVRQILAVGVALLRRRGVDLERRQIDQ